MIKSTKIAISIPKDNFDKIEAMRKKMGLQRSALIDRAICFWLNSMEQQEMIKKYEKGYRAIPESVAEAEALEKLSADAFSDEEWQ